MNIPKKLIIEMVSGLLDIAAGTFSNHGCNNLPEELLILDEEQWQELYKAYHEWNGDPEDYDPEQLGYLGDSMLMSFFSENLEQLMEKGA